MVCDMVWRGAFHRHIMTSGGRTATPATTIQLDNELTLPAMPALHTAEIQSPAMMAFETSCMFPV